MVRIPCGRNGDLQRESSFVTIPPSLQSSNRSRSWCWDPMLKVAVVEGDTYVQPLDSTRISYKSNLNAFAWTESPDFFSDYVKFESCEPTNAKEQEVAASSPAKKSRLWRRRMKQQCRHVSIAQFDILVGDIQGAALSKAREGGQMIASERLDFATLHDFIHKDDGIDPKELRRHLKFLGSTVNKMAVASLKAFAGAFAAYSDFLDATFRHIYLHSSIL